MKIHPLAEAIASSNALLSNYSEKIKAADGARLAMRNLGWAEGSELVKSLNQANGMTSLHGLVVHGAACASLLALGSMAAVGRESSYELVTARAENWAPVAEYIGRWPTAEAKWKSLQQDPMPKPVEHQSFDAIRVDPMLYTQLNEWELASEIHLDEFEINNAVDSTLGSLALLIEAESWGVESDQVVPIDRFNGFSFELLNQQDASGVLHEDRPRFAGKAQPGSLIELLDQNGAVLAASRADASGQWHIMPSAPLANGEYDFTLYATDLNGLRELMAPPIHLVIAVEPPTLQTVIEAIEAPTLSVLPILENEPGLDLTLILPVEVHSGHGNFAFGLSDLLPTSEPELLFAASSDDVLAINDESALQQLIHPEGGITLWEQQEDLALIGLDYSPSATFGSSDFLFADLMNNNDY